MVIKLFDDAIKLRTKGKGLMGNQDKIFFDGEGDSFYTRRLEKKESVERRLAEDLAILLLERSGYIPSNVAEIGACDGFRLAYIADKYGAQCHAYEPSEKAVEAGKRLYPQVEFRRELAAELSAEDESYDLVIVNEVFHWVDRKALLRSVAEIDRILKEEGLLIIGDFYPPFPVRRKYHHLPDKDVWTYKQQYIHIFLSSQLYYLLNFMSKAYSQDNQDSRDRKTCALLRKSIKDGYATIT